MKHLYYDYCVNYELFKLINFYSIKSFDDFIEYRKIIITNNLFYKTFILFKFLNGL